MLAQLVDEYISEKRTAEVERNDKFRVSDAGRCRLMRYWKRQGRPASDEPDARAYRVFEVGHVFHLWLQGLLTEKKLIIDEELEVEDLHRRGHIDAIILNHKGFILYDFKTVHSRKFSYLKKDADLHYHFQVTSYAMMMPYGIKEARIAYVSKDDLRIQEIPVHWETLAPEVTHDWNMLIDAWERQTEPVANPNSWECKYCMYSSSCTHAVTPDPKTKKNNNKPLLAEPIEQAVAPFTSCTNGENG